MDLVTILAAADDSAHNETPFLVVGGILAVFAIVVGALGIARHDLPESLTKAIMGVATVLVVGTMLTVIAT